MRAFFILTVLGSGVLGLSLANAVFLDGMTMDNNRQLELKVDRSHREIAALREESRQYMAEGRRS